MAQNDYTDGPLTVKFGDDEKVTIEHENGEVYRMPLAYYPDGAKIIAVDRVMVSMACGDVMRNTNPHAPDVGDFILWRLVAKSSTLLKVVYRHSDGSGRQDFRAYDIDVDSEHEGPFDMMSHYKLAVPGHDLFGTGVKRSVYVSADGDGIMVVLNSTDQIAEAPGMEKPDRPFPAMKDGTWGEAEESIEYVKQYFKSSGPVSGPHLFTRSGLSVE